MIAQAPPKLVSLNTITSLGPGLREQFALLAVRMECGHPFIGGGGGCPAIPPVVMVPPVIVAPVAESPPSFALVAASNAVLVAGTLMRAGIVAGVTFGFGGGSSGASFTFTSGVGFCFTM